LEKKEKRKKYKIQNWIKYRLLVKNTKENLKEEKTKT
jgi:hypothetical protein